MPFLYHTNFYYLRRARISSGMNFSSFSSSKSALPLVPCLGTDFPYVSGQQSAYILDVNDSQLASSLTLPQTIVLRIKCGGEEK